MKSKITKGFTLIELIGVIVLLGVIALITVPTINTAIDKSRTKAYNTQVDYIIEASKKWATSNPASLPDYGYTSIKLATLVTDGFLTDSNIINPKDNTKMTGCVFVTYNDSTSSYTYNYSDTCQYNINKLINAPKLVDGMTPIKWDSDNKEVTTTSSDTDWYDYASGKWANAKTKDGSYWVWVPRYAYKITSNYHSNQAGNIDVKFLIGTSDNTIDGTTAASSGYVVGTNDTSDNYFVEPAFDENSSVTGFWVAKFEPTASEGLANDETFSSDGTCASALDDVTTKTIKIVPNVMSWRCISMSNAYKTTAAMASSSTYGWQNANINTHVMTGLEWGAIAYLSQSSYGAASQIWINNSSKYTTGCAGSSATDSAFAGCEYAYNSVKGVNASTTHNITGIYDMSGGAFEGVMSLYNNISADSGFTASEISNITYLTKYTTSSSNLLNSFGMDYDSTVYGDALYETTSNIARLSAENTTSGPTSAAWYGGSSILTSITNPWLGYGGAYLSGSTAGLFAFSGGTGSAENYGTFRPVVYVES